jgi:hypothetical protein
MLLDPNLGLARNVVLLLANRNSSLLEFYHHQRYVLSQSRVVVVGGCSQPYSWNLKREAQEASQESLS